MHGATIKILKVFFNCSLTILVRVKKFRKTYTVGSYRGFGGEYCRHLQSHTV